MQYKTNSPDIRLSGEFSVVCYCFMGTCPLPGSFVFGKGSFGDRNGQHNLALGLPALGHGLNAGQLDFR